MGMKTTTFIAIVIFLATIPISPGNSFADSKTIKSRIKDREGRTVLQSKQTGNTTIFQDKDGKTVEMSVRQADGTVRVMDSQERTLYVVQPQR